ncbi:hypothetical protein ABPG75_013576 [Micractinium tetrahymenae]
MEDPSPWARALALGDRRRLLGLAFILAVALIWVAASFFVQGIEEQGAHPAVLTFVANSLFAVYVPIYYLNLRLRRRHAAAAAAARHAQERAALVPAGHPRSDDDSVGGPAGLASSSPLAEGEEEEEGGSRSHGGRLGLQLGTPTSPPVAEDSANGKAHVHGGPPPMPLRQLFRAALVVAPLWYCAQLAFNMSLQRTSVTSNTILSSTSALFTFLFAVALLSEVFTLWKLGFILLLIVGTAMVTLADGKYSEDASAARQSVAGDLLCLLSAVIYGAYTVSIRKLLREDEDTPMTMFFGFMGLLIFASVGPLLLVLWLAGVGLGVMSWRVFGLMVVKGLADNVLSDYLWARAILLVGPTIATAGLALQVPLAVLLDALLRSPAWLAHAGSAVLTLLGGAVVLAGFFGVNAAGEDDEKTRHSAWEERQDALQRELGFDLEDPEFDPEFTLRAEDDSLHPTGVATGQQLGAAAGSPYAGRAMRAMEQALQRQLSFEGEEVFAGGRAAIGVRSAASGASAGQPRKDDDDDGKTA